MIKKKSKMKDKKIEIDLAGPEGNAFYLMGVASKLAKQLGLNNNKILEEMKGGDYDNLINVFEKYFGDMVTLYK